MAELKAYIERQPLDPALMTPELAELHAYWLGLPRRGTFPEPKDFKLVELSNRLLPLTTVVDLEPDGVRYRFWGTGRTALFGYDPTGKRVADVPLRLGNERIIGQYELLLEERAPVLLMVVHPLASGLLAECQTLRLPLASDGETIDRVVSASRFIRNERQFQEARHEAIDG